MKEMNRKKGTDKSFVTRRLLMLVTALAVGTVSYSCKPKTQPARVDSRRQELEAARKAREELEAQRRKAEAEARKLAREREEAEERKRQAEREAKELERERQRKEMREKAEAERRNKAMCREIAGDFRKATCLFASDLKKNAGKFDKDEIVYLVGEDYLTAKNFYKLECQGGKIKTAHRISEREGMQELSESDMNAVTDCKRCILLRENGVVEFWGTGSNVREIEASPDDSISPLDIELAELSEVVRQLSLQAPDCRYRVSLKNEKTSEKIRLGIIEAKEEIKSSLVSKTIEETILERRAKKGKDMKPPKLKEFKPTVVLYDGDIIRKEIRVTKVPRVFKHLGTTHYGWKSYKTVEDARARWQKLYDEALRQEEKAKEREEENRRIMAEYESKMRNFTARPITQEEREAELSNYVILIERSLTKPNP